MNAKQIFLIVVYPWMCIILWLFLSGDWYWPELWIWNVVWLFSMYFMSIYLYLKNPALLKERMKLSSDDQDPADKIIFKFLILSFALWFILMPIDAKRYKWSTTLLQINTDYPIIKYMYFIGVCIGDYMTFRSLYDCSFLSPVLRVQKERNQTVIDSGLFGIIRHPMYSGITIWTIFSALFLGSFYAFLASIFIMIVLYVRIGFEEAMLEKDLDGYTEYKKRVKYKLIPYVI